MTPAERMKLMDAICRQSAASLRNMALKLTLLSDTNLFSEVIPVRIRNKKSTCKYITPIEKYDQRIAKKYVSKFTGEVKEFLYEPFVKLYPSFIVRYSTSVDYHSHKKKENDIQMPLSNKSKGLLSDKSQGRLKRIINLLIALSTFKPLYSKVNKKWYSFKLGLLTLTLSSEQIHSDDEIKKLLLQPMLRRLRTIYNVKNYIWKAEAQD